MYAILKPQSPFPAIDPHSCLALDLFCSQAVCVGNPLSRQKNSASLSVVHPPEECCHLSSNTLHFVLIQHWCMKYVYSWLMHELALHQLTAGNCGSADPAH